MEENNRLTVASITLSLIFNVLSFAILIGMNPGLNPCIALGDEIICRRNKAKATPFQKWVAIITWVIGASALACWAAALGLNSNIGLTSSNSTIQSWYIIGTILAILDTIWMVITIKYWGKSILFCHC